MSYEKGNLSINSENILPIIKKWLYSDSDIFIREMVSNATDAITKLKKLVDMGEAENVPRDEEYSITVRLDKEAGTISIIDNGIGMSADEVKQYINQIAFSGASDFMEKYKDRLDKENEIIGHFGLGFYSAFMVADKVQIDTLSYREGEQAARWVCEGGIDFEMDEGDKTTRGTTITLYIGDESKDFLEEYKLRSTLTKYCGFIPVEIYFEVVNKDGKIESDDADLDDLDMDDLDSEDMDSEDAEDDDTEDDDTEDDMGDLEDLDSLDGADSEDSDADIIDMDEIKDEEAKDEKKPEKSGPKPINDIHPLWTKQPNECTDEEYKSFYHKVFTDFNDPLFWIHLNMDYPFRLKGILYFPKLKHELESIEGQVKLYNNQVFIADNIKEVIPEFMLLLKGTIDCPDLPLNVSRSFLQNDGYVTKMSGYITRKVADKLNSMFKKDRETYNKYWDDISPFIKYGCIKEKDFYEKIKDSVVFKTTAGDYTNLTEFLERNKEKCGDKVFYVSNEKLQSQYIKLFKDNDMEAVILTTNLDNPFISYLESYEHKVHFNRIDSDLSDTLKNKDGAEDNKEQDAELEKLFKDALNKSELKIKAENLKTESISAIMLLSEQSRRMQEMSVMFGGGLGPNMFANEETLVLNKNNGLVKTLLEIKDDEAKKDDRQMIIEQIYDLAMMSHKPLETDAMTKFIERSNKLLEKIAKG